MRINILSSGVTSILFFRSYDRATVTCYSNKYAFWIPSSDHLFKIPQFSAIGKKFFSTVSKSQYLRSDSIKISVFHEFEANCSRVNDKTWTTSALPWLHTNQTPGRTVIMKNRISLWFRTVALWPWLASFSMSPRHFRSVTRHQPVALVIHAWWKVWLEWLKTNLITDQWPRQRGPQQCGAHCPADEFRRPLESFVLVQ